MQRCVNEKAAKVRPKQDLQSSKIHGKAEESDLLTHDYNPLGNITCKIGDNACVAKHVSLIQRAGLFHPMNESQKVQSLLKLQQQYGNRFVQRVIAQHVIQTKLTTSKPGDIYEQESNRAVEAVMRMLEPHVQRQPEEEEEEAPLQAKPLAGQNTPLVQIGRTDDAYEREANQIANLVTTSSDWIPGGFNPAQPSVQRACGPAEVGSVGGCTGLTGDVTGEAFLFVVNCDDFRSGEEARLRAFSATLGPEDILEIHGFASEEGPADFNENLSCARAHKAQSVLTSAGVPIAKIRTLYKHGTTPGARAERRSVVITKSSAAPGGLTVTPCSSLPFLIGSRGGCGSGSDFTYLDFPSLSLTDELKVLPFRPRTDSELLGIFTLELGALAGSTGLSMIALFASGTGARNTHGIGSHLSTLTAISGTFRRVLGVVRSNINSRITSQASGGAINCNSLSIPSGSMPTISFTFADGTTLKAAIGGTQGLNLFITGFSLSPRSRTYTITLRFEICDDFGVDKSDLYSPGLISFWVLQHERPGHRPFINEIIVEETISDSF
jgi:outer membrane protein OmpA-like peptidoglycan-associated protein